MEKLFTGELTKTIILISVVMAGTSLLLVKFIMLISKLQGSFKPYQKGIINYILLALVLFSVIASIAYWSYLANQQIIYLIYQFYFICLGVIHIYTMKKYLGWSDRKNSVGPELIFSTIIIILGSLGFFFIYHFISPNTLELNMASSTICFIIPWFVNQTYLNASAIPAPVLKQWYYPLSQEMDEPDEDKLKNLLVISFVIQKKLHNAHYTNFRAKAPVDMELGELYYYFINDYNERNPNDKIEYTHPKVEPYGWIFYLKPLFKLAPKRYLDAEKTIYNNRIKENNVIICERYFTN